jgi:hypothetical protein
MREKYFSFTKFLALIISMALCLNTTGYGQQINIHKMTAVPNSTGIQLGFWELSNKQPYTLECFGKRPTSRVDFTSWKSIETSQGVYDFTGVFDRFRFAHSYGETVLGAINICFSAQVTPSKSTIPSFYYDRITNATTRQAAKNFLYAYVQEALTEVGSIILTIDYEIVSNYKLSAVGSESRAAEWGTWYVEAAAVARQAAADIGMSDKLKLQPIVNGDPFAVGNPIYNGPSTNQWLVDVINASDFLALDTYQSNPIYSSTSAQTIFDIIQFWTDNYSGTKDVMVTENGFTTITSIDTSITREDRNYKTTGTEADQAVFYQNIFNQLGPSNLTTGIFHNKLRSYNIWSIRDNTNKPVGNEDRYFGLVGIDSSGNDYLKPAMPVVQAGYSALETSAFHQPETITADSVITNAFLNAHAHLPVQYNAGDDFGFLRYTDSNLTPCTNYSLVISTVYPGNIIVHVNNKWLYEDADTTFNINITQWCTAGALNIIDVYFTGGKFPFYQQVRNLQLIGCTITEVDATPLKQEISIMPNPAQSEIYLSGIDNSENFITEIYNTTGQIIIHTANEASVNISDLPAGVYFLKISQDNEIFNLKFIKE